MKIDARAKDYIPQDWLIVNGETGEPIRQVCMVDSDTGEYIHADDPPRMADDGDSIAVHHKTARRIDIYRDTLVVKIWP